MSRGYGRHQREVLTAIDTLASYTWNGRNARMQHADRELPLWPLDQMTHLQRWHTLEMAGLVNPLTTRSERNGLTRAVRRLAATGVLEIAHGFPYRLLEDDDDDLAGVDTTFSELRPPDQVPGGPQLWFRRKRSGPVDRVVRELARIDGAPIGVRRVSRGAYVKFDDDASDYLDPIAGDQLLNYFHSTDRSRADQSVVAFLGWYFYGWFLPGVKLPDTFGWSLI